MASKQSVEGEVRAVGRGGDAVVETPNGIVLVPGALPGERVELALTSSKRGAARGYLTRVLRAAAERREPPCADAPRCGGCPLMIAGPELQRDIKRSFLRDACRGLPGADETEIEWVASNLDLAYRRRARLAWHRDTIGYRQLHSKRVTDIGQCIVLLEPLREGWREVRECLASSLRGAGEIQLQLTDADRVVVDLHANDDQAPELFEACDALCQRPVIAGVTLRTKDAGRPASWGETHVVIQMGEGATLEGPYPRVALEWLVARAPEVLLDSSRDATPAAEYWKRLPSLPAVRADRVIGLSPGTATLPGPWLDRGLWILARALHGDSLAETAAP